jgi:hypothetical protein
MASLQRTNKPGDMVTSRQIRGAILPWEKQLIDTLGLTIEEYNWYANAVANYRPERDPAYDVVPEVQCTGFETFLVTTIVGAALSVASSAMAPKPKLPKQTDPAQQQQQEQRGADVSGASVNGSNRFTNVDGFTSVQPLARLGESMQLVFANRRNNYGGVRVETKLLWSQLLSQGDGQELLAIFLANGGELASQPDFDGMGIGDSLLRGYQASKLAMYFRNGNSANRISIADKKAGDLTPRNNSDVFLAELKTLNNMQPIFSGVRIPSTMSIFGISEPLRNGQHWQLPFKRVRVIYPPGVVFQFNFELWARDQQEYNKKVETVQEAGRERQKTLSFYAPRTGLIAARNSAGTLLTGPASQQVLDIDIAVDDTIEFHVYEGNSPNLFGDIGNQDIAAKEDSIREAIDDVVIVGETYLVAGVEAVCVKESTNNLWDIKTKKIFTFKATQVGKTRLTHEGVVINNPLNNIEGFNQLLSQTNPSFGPTVCKLAIAHFTTTRKLNQVEIGIKSQVFKRFAGIANFASIPSDGVLDRIERGGNNFNVGSYSEYGLRYSFFRVEVKEKGATDWHRLVRGGGGIFCVKGRTPVSQFNFIRIAFPNSKDVQYEVRFRPVAGGAYLAYNFPGGNPVCVLDARTGGPEEYSVSTPIGPFTVAFKGYLERVNNITATNDVLFLGGRPPGGGVLSLNPLKFDYKEAIFDQIYDQNLDGGNGGYVRTSKIIATSHGSGSGLTVSVLALQRRIATPVGEVVIGLQTRWLHQGIMGAGIPMFDGEEFTGTVRFRKGPYYVDVRFTLRARTFAGYAQDYGVNGYGGTGYGTAAPLPPPNEHNNSEGWPYDLLWTNLNRFPSKVLITDFNGFSLDDEGNPYFEPSANGVYEVNIPPGFPTPANGRVKAEINVTFTNQETYQVDVQVRDGGSGYKVGDVVTIDGLDGTPGLKVTAVSDQSVGARILEPFDAIADVYMNDGQEGSHQNGPEHAIVYINEQRENVKLDKQPGTINTISYAPTYKDMTLLGLQLRSGKEWSSFNNFTYYAKQGCKVRKIINDTNNTTYNVNSTPVYSASNLYPEILYHLVATSNLMPTTMIDWDGFAEGCKVCLANNFYWDGVLSAPVNIRDWGHENAQYFFLDFLVLGGKLSLQPTFPVNKGSDLSGYTLGGAYDRKPVISALFTDGNIIEDSLSVNWYPAEQRKAPQVLVTMRDEVENGFAETRNILVKRNDPSNPNPQVEAVDFTGFCTSADHAIQFAKLLINMRYHITHVISFKTLPNGLALQPGQYFRVSSQARHVEQFQNGYVLADGTVVSSNPMTAGSYTVYFWRSGMLQVEERSMVIDATGKTTPEFSNSVFTEYNNAVTNRLYKAEMIAYDEEGMVEVTGSHVPLEADGRIRYLNMDATLFEVQNEQ